MMTKEQKIELLTRLKNGEITKAEFKQKIEDANYSTITVINTGPELASCEKEVDLSDRNDWPTTIEFIKIKTHI